MQNSGCLLQLVELIPRQPNKLDRKKISVGKLLEKFRLFSSVVSPSLDYLRRPRADLKKKLGVGTPCKIPVVPFS